LVVTEQSTRRDIVVVGASAGGVEALTRLVSALPEDLPAAVFVVLHVGPHYSVLPAVLGRRSRLPVAHAVDGEPVEPARVYVAPPDRHLLLEPGVVRVTSGPPQHGLRPAIDPLFRSAALAYRERVAAVVLSGALDDGSLGCRTIIEHGGTTLVQSPDDAAYPSMPRSAIEHDTPSYVGSAEDLALELVELARGPRGGAPAAAVGGAE
jgi:two-component system, chemotaxis family, protein-glutamate methylesterase/glutaminase